MRNRFQEPARHASARTAGLRAWTLRALVKRLADFSDDGSRMTAHFADGSDATGDVLVGCDGIHSATRGALLPAGPVPAYTGLVGTGGFVRPPRRLVRWLSGEVRAVEGGEVDVVLGPPGLPLVRVGGAQIVGAGVVNHSRPNRPGPTSHIQRGQRMTYGGRALEPRAPTSSPSTSHTSTA